MMTVNEFSRLGAVAPHVVRYYARIGLLAPIRHPDNGYKLFSRTDAVRLQFIRNAQSLGYSLEEVRRLLALSGKGKSVCQEARTILRQRLAENRAKIEELRALQCRMERAIVGTTAGQPTGWNARVPADRRGDFERLTCA